MKYRVHIFLLALAAVILGCGHGPSSSDESTGSVRQAGVATVSTYVELSQSSSFSGYGDPVAFQACVKSDGQPVTVGQVNVLLSTENLSLPLDAVTGCATIFRDALPITTTSESPGHVFLASYPGFIDGGTTYGMSSPAQPLFHSVDFSSTYVYFSGETASELMFGEPVSFKVAVDREGVILKTAQSESATTQQPLPGGIPPLGKIQLFQDGVPCTAPVGVTIDPSNHVTSSATFTYDAGVLGDCILDVTGQGLHDLEATFVGDGSPAPFNDSDTDNEESGLSIYVYQAPASLWFNGGTASRVGVNTQSVPVSVDARPADGSPSTATPDGTVIFEIIQRPDEVTTIVFGTAIGTLVNGTATTTVTTKDPLAEGTYIITARYPGTQNFYFFGEGTTDKELVVASSTFELALTMSAPLADGQYTSTYGLPVTFTAKLTSENANPPMGTVDFFDNGSLIATVDFANGESVVNTEAFRLSAGPHTIRAYYQGDADHQNTPDPGDEDIQSLLIAPHPTSVSAVTVAPNPAHYGDLIVFSAHVGFSKLDASDAPETNPAGHVDFFLGGNPVGSGAVDASGNAAYPALGNQATRLLPVATSQSVTATFVPTATALPGFVITAPGPTNFSGSSATGSPLTVDKATSSVALSASASTTTVGTNVDFSALVSSPGNYTLVSGESIEKRGSMLTGTVQFFDGATALTTVSTGSESGESELYKFSTTALTPGSHTITAVYSGNGTFAKSSVSNPVTIVVNQDGIGATLTSSANPSLFGGSITFTTSLTATTGGAPTGKLTFTDGAATLGTATLSSTGAATSAGSVSSSTLAVGTHTITVSYSGDANHPGGPIASMIQTVNKALTTLAVASSGSPLVFGQALTFTATVSSAVAGDKSGVVSFVDGSTSLGTALANPAGVATLTVGAPLSIGSHTITTSYAGNLSFGASSAALTQSITKAASALALSSARNPSLLGTNVTLLATASAVAPGSGTPTGSIAFTIDGVLAGNGALDATGVASFSATKLTEGAHTITASYAGDTHFAGSAASSFTQNVSASAATVNLTIAPSPSTWKGTVTLTATISGTPAGGDPTGTVLFTSGGVLLGTAPVTAGSATATTTTLPIGTSIVTAAYSGDTHYAAVMANGTISVDKAPTMVTVASSQNPAQTGTPVTITATVASAVTGFTGQVEFFAGTTSLGTVALTGNTASFTATSLLTGTLALKATYKGDEHFLTSSSEALSQTVNAAPDAGIEPGGSSSSSSGATVTPGADAGTTIGLGGINPGGDGGSGDDCAVTNVGSPVSGLSWLVGLALSAVFLSRRRRR